jgi:hypothetical protein
MCYEPMNIPGVQVIISIQRTSASMDEELLQQSSGTSNKRPSGSYSILKGRLFSAVPAALAFIVRFGLIAGTVASTLPEWQLNCMCV